MQIALPIQRMERRPKRRTAAHPLAEKAKLRPQGPALERRREPRTKPDPSARITLQLPAELTERLRNAVYWTPGLTLTAVVCAALQRAAAEMETENGGVFRKREQKLRIGRPVKPL